MHQRYIRMTSTTFVAATNGRGKALFDLKSILEGLCGDGEELDIKSAKAVLQVFGDQDTVFNLDHTFQALIMVADAAIASANAGSPTYDIDELLDAMTSGNYEFKLLGEPLVPQLRRNDYNAADKLECSASRTLDITKPVRKASLKLIRSALLATNPEISFVVVSPAGVGTTYKIRLGIKIDYVVRTRPARMI